MCAGRRSLFRTFYFYCSKLSGINSTLFFNRVFALFCWRLVGFPDFRGLDRFSGTCLEAAVSMIM
jgi:hypothetical protein